MSITPFFRADLHCHSSCSDGSLEPEALVAMAANRELAGLAITDHDTFAAYEAAFPAANLHSIQLITGVEFSSEWQGASLHILGYGFAMDHPKLLELCERHTERRWRRNQAMLEKLHHHGFSLDIEELYAQGAKAVGRPHIARLLVEKGYVTDMRLAFLRYLGDRACCYVSLETISSEETIDLLHEAGGVAILAHPHLLREEIELETLLALPFDGLEAYYGSFSYQKNNQWVEHAKKRGWKLITGGSDYHGELKQTNQLGSSWVAEEIFSPLLALSRKNNPLAYLSADG